LSGGDGVGPCNESGRVMKKLLLMSGILSLALIAPVAAERAKQDFTLVNSTGYEIKRVFVSPTKSDNWEEDVLGDGELDDGDHTNIHFSRSGSTCRWDLKVIYTVDDSSAVWRDIDLCRISKITIKYNRKSDTTSAIFD
jgi:hypothetical protein